MVYCCQSLLKGTCFVSLSTRSISRTEASEILLENKVSYTSSVVWNKLTLFYPVAIYGLNCCGAWNEVLLPISQPLVAICSVSTHTTVWYIKEQSLENGGKTRTQHKDPKPHYISDKTNISIQRQKLAK